MKKKVLRFTTIILLALIVQQVYWYNKLDGNLIILVTNASEKDSVDITLNLDGKQVFSDVLIGKYINYKNKCSRSEKCKQMIICYAVRMSPDFAQYIKV